MPLIVPASGDLLDIEDRWRSLLAAEPSLAGTYSGAIRDFPPNNIEDSDSDGEEYTLSLWSPDFDYLPHTVNKKRYEPRLRAQWMGYEPQDADTATVSAIRRRLLRLADVTVKAIEKYRRDPDPSCLWFAVRWVQNPTGLYKREPQQYQTVTIQFEALQNPQ